MIQKLQDYIGTILFCGIGILIMKGLGELAPHLILISYSGVVILFFAAILATKKLFE